MNSLISVIVPVYNADSSLAACVESILSQQDVTLELLLVDDGSTDASADLCDRFAAADGRVKALHQPNGGVSSARNAGLAAASGTYIMFVDSDDHMLPGMCAMMQHSMETQQADLVVCGTTEPGGHVWAPEKDAFYASRRDFDQDLPYWLQTELLGPPWNKIYRRDLLHEGFPEDVSFGEDLMFNLRFLKGAQRVAFVAAAPFFHEKRNGRSLVNCFDAKKLHDIEAVQREVAGYAREAGVAFPYGKYLRDLLVYSKGYLKSPSFSWKEKRLAVRAWRRQGPLLRTHRISTAGLRLKDRFYLWVLCHL